MRYKEAMPPSKKINKKGGKKMAGRKYSEVLEEYDEREGMEDNHPARKPADISQALRRSKEGYSKKPRVKAQKKVPKSKR